MMTNNASGSKFIVGLVGCGRIAKNHFLAIDTNSDFCLAAVCDTDENILNNCTKKYAVPGFLNIQDMLRTVKLDLVILCTPSGYHAEQAITASEYKVNILTEKPMATSFFDGVSMVNAASKNNVNLFVVKQNRYNKTIKLLRQAMLDGRFGKIFLYNSNVFWARSQEYYDQADWRGTWKLDGGALMNQASHYLDLMQWLCGPVISVNAMSGTLSRKIEAEDTIVLNMRSSTGSLGSMSVTMLTYPNNLEGSLTIIGERGTVKIGGVALNKIEKWDFHDEKSYDSEIVDSSYSVESVYGFGHNLYYTELSKALKGEQAQIVNGIEGLKSLELIVAAYQSAKKGIDICLPFEERSNKW